MENKDRLTGSERVEQSPPEAQFNADLANRVGEDTQNLIVGELSEDEYYHKYHQAYLKEFGVDNRPVIQDTAPLKQISRRTLLKVGGIALAGILGARLLGNRALATEGTNGNNYASLLLKGDEATDPQATRVQMGMVIDLEKCDGCLSCSFACHHHNSNPQGVIWIYVLAYQDENQDGVNFLVRPCMHCSNPPCVKVCPVRARHKREKDGLVLTDYNLCIGCRYCLVTCPYGVNYFQWDDPPPRNHAIEKYTDYRGRWVIGNPPKGCMGKCEFCPERQDDGRGNVVCELACPHEVIQFGDMNDPNSRPNLYLDKKREENGGQLSTFRLLENHGTKPNVLYIGQQPSRSAKPVEGPVSYADWGLVEKRLPLLGGYEPWFMKIFGGSR
jgi:molybdopterin-containing oxidoreductase family iron-sulfur binding subunit